MEVTVAFLVWHWTYVPLSEGRQLYYYYTIGNMYLLVTYNCMHNQYSNRSCVCLSVNVFSIGSIYHSANTYNYIPSMALEVCASQWMQAVALPVWYWKYVPLRQCRQLHSRYGIGSMCLSVNAGSCTPSMALKVCASHSMKAVAFPVWHWKYVSLSQCRQLHSQYGIGSMCL